MGRKIALAGIGKIARDQHIPTIAASADWELAAIVSRNASLDDVDSYSDIDGLLAARPDIDVVSLCMPPVPRFDIALRALEAGRHVMLEKPPGATLTEVQTLQKIAEAKGLTLYASWHSREAAQVAAAKAWLAGKRIKHFRVVWKEDVRRWHPGQEWIFEPGGMGVFDPGINALSIVTEIMHDDIHLTDAVLEFPANRQAPIAAQLNFWHPEGADVSAVFDWRQEGEQTWEIEILTDAGLLKLTGGGAEMSIDGVQQPGPEAALHGEYAGLYAQMAKLVKNGTSDVDLRPMTHVADALTLGQRKIVEAFEF